jgi:hypothetical protein
VSEPTINAPMKNGQTREQALEEIRTALMEMPYESLPIVQNLEKAAQQAKFRQAPDLEMDALARERDIAVKGLYDILHHIGTAETAVWEDYAALKRIARRKLIELGEIEEDNGGKL